MVTPQTASSPALPVVAHVNYLFFHSTQSFIYHYLRHLTRVRPICLTRRPESRGIAHALPAGLAADYYLYGDAERSALGDLLWSAGLGARALLAHLPPRIADPALTMLQTQVLPRVRRDSRPRDYLAWAEAILRRRNAALLHAYFAPIGWRMLELKEKLGIPLVVSFLGDDVAPSLGPWWWWWIQDGDEVPDWPARLAELCARADLLLVEGPYLRERLIELGAPPDKVQVQRIAIPVRDMPLAPQRERRDGPIVLLFAGRLCEQKGLLYVLEALAAIRAQRRDVVLRIVGDDTLTDGRYAAHVNDFIRRRRLEDAVTRLGFLNHADYLRELARADVFVHPSVVDANGASEGGAPTTILEAQATGLPVVSTLHCDIPNVTVPGESALLVPERDAPALAAAICSLLDDPARRAAMGRAGRAHVERCHDIAQEALLLEERYAVLLHGHDRA